MKLAGASGLKLKGSTTKLGIKGSGASHLNLEDYKAQDAVVSASGATHVAVNVTGVLEGNADGASWVYHIGKPEKLTTSIVTNKLRARRNETYLSRY